MAAEGRKGEQRKGRLKEQARTAEGKRSAEERKGEEVGLDGGRK